MDYLTLNYLNYKLENVLGALVRSVTKLVDCFCILCHFVLLHGFHLWAVVEKKKEIYVSMLVWMKIAHNINIRVSLWTSFASHPFPFCIWTQGSTIALEHVTLDFLSLVPTNIYNFFLKQWPMNDFHVISCTWITQRCLWSYCSWSMEGFGSKFTDESWAPRRIVTQMLIQDSQTLEVLLARWVL